MNFNAESSRQLNQKKTVRNSKIEIIKNIKINNKKKVYSKNVYQRNAMTILFITDEFDEKTIFEHLNFENITSATALYQLMSNTKKKIFVKQAKLILTSKSVIYIKKDEAIF